MSGCVGGSQQAYVSCLEDCTCLATTAYAQYCSAAFAMNASSSARERECYTRLLLSALNPPHHQSNSMEGRQQKLFSRERDMPHRQLRGLPAAM